MAADQWGGQATALHQRLTALEQAAARTPPERHGISLDLHVTNNQITVLVPNGPSGIGLLAFDTEEDMQSTLVMAANRIRTNADFAPVALIVFVERCAITGNLILNEALGAKPGLDRSGLLGPLSLVLYPIGQKLPSLPGDPVAVTGNVFQNRPILPPRMIAGATAPPPMDRWEFLNSLL